jgi:hypothetical protein
MKARAHVSLIFDLDTLESLGISFSNEEEFHDFCIDALAKKIRSIDVNSDKLFSLIKLEPLIEK